MIKQLMHLLFSTGLLSAQVSDDGFFNEPSTMRPQLTAAAAKDSSVSDDLSSPPAASASTYQVIANGLPGAKIHYAAPSA